MIFEAAAQSCSGVSATEGRVVGGAHDVAADRGGLVDRAEDVGRLVAQGAGLLLADVPTQVLSEVAAALRISLHRASSVVPPPSAPGPVGWSFLGEGLHALALVVRREEQEERAPLEV